MKKLIPPLSLGTKIFAAFFLISLFISVSLSAGYFILLKNELTSNIRRCLKDVALFGARTLDPDAFGRLTDHIKKKAPGGVYGALDGENEYIFPRETINAIEYSREYKIISDQLNDIRNSGKGLILYVYTLVPTADARKARFVVDSDVLKYNEIIRRTGKAPELVAHFSMAYDISGQPVTMRALSERINIVDTEFRRDENWNVNSIMGFAPIYGRDGTTFLGALGVDISEGNMSAALERAYRYALLFFIMSLCSALFLSWLLNRRLTGNLIRLKETVHEFGETSYAARADVPETGDEIEHLARSFNTMADLIQSRIETLTGLVPICASCKKVRNDGGYWEQVEKYVESHTKAQFTHGLCPACEEKLYGNEKWYKKRKQKEKQEGGFSSH